MWQAVVESRLCVAAPVRALPEWAGAAEYPLADAACSQAGWAWVLLAGVAVLAVCWIERGRW